MPASCLKAFSLKHFAVAILSLIKSNTGSQGNYDNNLNKTIKFYKLVATGSLYESCIMFLLSVRLILLFVQSSLFIIIIIIIIVIYFHLYC